MLITNKSFSNFQKVLEVTHSALPIQFWMARFGQGAKRLNSSLIHFRRPWEGIPIKPVREHTKKPRLTGYGPGLRFDCPDSAVVASSTTKDSFGTTMGSGFSTVNSNSASRCWWNPVPAGIMSMGAVR